jgi:regulatory protein
MIVTRLSSDRALPGHVVVEVDGGRFASLPVEVAQELKLQAGKFLDDAAVVRLRGAADAEAAYRVGTGLLAARPRSVLELTRKLRDRGHPESAIRAALERLRNVGAVNDLIYAQHFARLRLARGHGPSRVLSDLLHRGVDRRTAERALADVQRDERIEPDEQVRRLLERRAALVQSLAPQVQRRRLVMYLARRGFRGREVRRLVEATLAKT